MKAYGRIGMKIYINEVDHMFKVVTIPIYDKNFINIFYSRTNGLMAMELDM